VLAVSAVVNAAAGNYCFERWMPLLLLLATASPPHTASG
jgi:hypothetical protein